jgi:hypothetical protein
MKVVEPIWATKPDTANHVRGRIETILDWATVRGYRQGEKSGPVAGASRQASAVAVEGAEKRNTIALRAVLRSCCQTGSRRIFCESSYI